MQNVKLYIFIAAMLTLVGCAGQEEARRTALLLADALDTYTSAVSEKITQEQKFYRQARTDFETQLKNEEETEKAWERIQPSLAVLDYIEQLVRDQNRLRVPGDLYGVLEEMSHAEEEKVRKIAESKTSFRKTYELNLAQLEFKRSELDQLRKVFESLALEITPQKRLEYVFEFANDVNNQLTQLKKDRK